MQCLSDFAAVDVIAMIATTISRKIGIRPVNHNDWSVTCNLWGAVVRRSTQLDAGNVEVATGVEIDLVSNVVRRIQT